MLNIALTGGIGVGKTAVSRLFAEKNIPIIDTDAIAHQLLMPNQPGFIKLIDKFGDKILTPEQQINRPLLREWVFHDEKLLKWLESWIHPMILRRVHEESASYQSPYVIVVIPLLYEMGLENTFDKVVVVHCLKDEQIKRVLKRDNMSLKTLEKIMAHQKDDAYRLIKADYVVDNNGLENNLVDQVNAIHHELLQQVSANESKVSKL